jgi:hypothetical protein
MKNKAQSGFEENLCIPYKNCYKLLRKIGL